jgi:hypothetical protein
MHSKKKLNICKSYIDAEDYFVNAQSYIHILTTTQQVQILIQLLDWIKSFIGDFREFVFVVLLFKICYIFLADLNFFICFIN